MLCSVGRHGQVVVPSKPNLRPGRGGDLGSVSEGAHRLLLLALLVREAAPVDSLGNDHHAVAESLRL